MISGLQNLWFNKNVGSCEYNDIAERQIKMKLEIIKKKPNWLQACRKKLNSDFGTIFEFNQDHALTSVSVNLGFPNPASWFILLIK